MKWEAFCRWTDTTAIYPGAGTGNITELSYIAMGLAGEFGEAIATAYHPDGTDEGMITEMRDALWYVARGYRAMEAHGYTLYNISPASAPYGVSLRISNVVKKLIRDGADKKKLDQLALMYPQALLEVMDTMYPEARSTKVLEEDLEILRAKLTSRKERGVLGGSGDKR